jgi:hypothetical protein
MVEAAENRERYDSPGPERSGLCRPSRDVLRQSLMGTGAVEERAVLLQHALKMPSPEDDDMVEAFSTHRPEEALAGRVHQRSVDCRPKDADTSAESSSIKVSSKLGVIISHDELRKLGVEGGRVAQLLSRPGRLGARVAATCTTRRVFTSTMKKAKTERKWMS